MLVGPFQTIIFCGPLNLQLLAAEHTQATSSKGGVTHIFLCLITTFPLPYTMYQCSKIRHVLGAEVKKAVAGPRNIRDLLTTFQNHTPQHQLLRALGLVCLRLWKAARLPHFPSEAGAFQVYICRTSVDSGPYFQDLFFFPSS